MGLRVRRGGEEAREDRGSGGRRSARFHYQPRLGLVRFVVVTAKALTDRHLFLSVLQGLGRSVGLRVRRGGEEAREDRGSCGRRSARCHYQPRPGLVRFIVVTAKALTDRHLFLSFFFEDDILY